MKIYVRSTDSIGDNAADQIQRFIDGYGFSKFAVYPRTDEYLAIDIEGEDEDEVNSLLNRLHAWNLDADIYDHYIEINIADDERFNDAVTASDAMNPGWSKRYDSELQMMVIGDILHRLDVRTSTARKIRHSTDLVR